MTIDPTAQFTEVEMEAQIDLLEMGLTADGYPSASTA